MPNSLAYIMLLLWPLVVVALFRRLPAERAVIWSLLGGYLLLPPVAAIDLPAIPPLDKATIPALAIYAMVRLGLGRPVPLMPESWAGRLLLGLFVLAPFGTVLTNAEAIPIGSPQLIRVLPGLTLYDAVSIIVNQGFVILTFAVARSLLASAAALRELLVALMLGGLVYTLPMLVEIRLSPQLNNWVYGFFQHSFAQTMRQGGFRPMVFLAHGLWVAFFVMTAFLAVLGLWRSAAPQQQGRYLLAAGWLLVVLVLAKSAGALIFALAMALPVMFAPPRWLLRGALAMGVLALAYPLLRAAGWFPADQLVELAARYSADRAQSLGFRFDNEGVLLQHALHKPWFGWGGYERNLLHTPWDGQVMTITDGRWIIVLGIHGWAGFIAEFGLLVLPLVLLWRRGAVVAGPVVATLAGIHGLNLIDMLPNATLTPLTWLIAGALLGHAEGRHHVEQSAALPSGQRTII